jgi:PAS domain S-box-containing protein
MPEAPGPMEQDRFFRLFLTADLSELSRSRRLMEELGRAAALPDDRLFDLQVAVSEAVANAIEHAASEVEIAAWLLPDRLIVEITNAGAFQPGLCKDEEPRRRGLGLPLMVSLADQVHVSRESQAMTRVTLTFFLRSEGAREVTKDSAPNAALAQLESERLKVGAALFEADRRAVEGRQSEERYRSLFENMLNGYARGQMVFDTAGEPVDFVYVAVNSAFERLTGLRDVVGRRVTEVIPDIKAANPELLDSFGRVALTGRPEQFELDFTPLGMWLTISVYSPERGYFVAVFDDISERKRAEEILRESEERFRTMANAMPQLAWMADPDGYIYWYNRRWYEYTGTTPAEMEGWGWQSVHDAKALPKVLERWRQSIATGQPFDMEFPLRGADGIFRAFLTRVMPLKDGDGRVLHWFGTNTDIDERKRAEEATEEQRCLLLAAQKDYRLLFSEMLDGLAVHEIILDDRGKPCDYRFLAVNPAFERLTGLCATDIVGKTVLEVIPDLELSWIERYGRVALTGDEAHFENHAAALGRHYEVTAYRPAEGRFATIFHDVTERVRAEQTLLRLNRTLAAHSASAQALIRATDEASYLTEVCRIVVEDCGHSMVWIGYKEEDDDKSIRPVASAGFDEGYLGTLKLTWADGERGRGPTGTTVRTGRPTSCRNMLTDPAFAPWRDEALRRGYASSVAAPLLQNGTAFGALTIYSSEPDSFADDEVKLLADLSDDLALGIATLRLRTAHGEAELQREILLAEEQKLTEKLLALNEELHSQTQELAAREQKLQEQNEELRASRYNRTLIEASLDPLVTIGLDGTITDVNKATVKISGYSRDELIGTDFADYFTAPERARSGYREVFTKGSVTDYPLTIRARDGRLTDVLYNATVYKDPEGKVLGVFAAARDMTAIIELEEQRAIASALQKALLDLPQRARGVEFGYLYRSATKQALVGGDFYDVFEAKGGRIAILIGDVSGHGLEAARIATFAKDVVHAFAHQFRWPHLVLRETNRLLVEKNLGGFVTAFLGFLDPESGTLTHSSAGHPPPLLATDGQVAFLTTRGLPLGVIADARYRNIETRIQEGGVLLLYTDGITEARQNGELYGEARLAAALGRMHDRPTEVLPASLLDEALAFSGGALRDDVALLAVNYARRTSGEATFAAPRPNSSCW